MGWIRNKLRYKTETRLNADGKWEGRVIDLKTGEELYATLYKAVDKSTAKYLCRQAKKSLPRKGKPTGWK